MNAEWQARYDAWRAEASRRRPAAASRRASRSRPTTGSRSASRARSSRPGYRLVLGTIAERARHERRARARGDPPARGRGARDVRAQRRRHVSMVDDSAVPVQHAGARASSRAPRPPWPPAASPPTTSAAPAPINERMIETLDHFDPRSFTALNQEFHSILFAQCANPRMLDLVNAEWARLGHLRDSTFSFVPGRAARVGARARGHPRRSSSRRPARRDRDGRPPPPLGHARRLPDPRTPRRGPRPPRLLNHSKEQP